MGLDQRTVVRFHQTVGYCAQFPCLNEEHGFGMCRRDSWLRGRHIISTADFSLRIVDGSCQHNPPYTSPNFPEWTKIAIRTKIAAAKIGAIRLLFDSVSVIAFQVYTHGFRSLSAGFAGTLVIARATGQRHAAMTGPSFAPWRAS
jgi:hypothetical protein